MDHNEIKKPELLALARTNLANERTILAYFRTFIVVLSSGFAILKIEILQNLITLGYFFIITSFIVILIGIIRFIHVKRKVKKYCN